MTDTPEAAVQQHLSEGLPVAKASTLLTRAVGCNQRAVPSARSPQGLVRVRKSLSGGASMRRCVAGVCFTAIDGGACGGESVRKRSFVWVRKVHQGSTLIRES